MTAPRYTKQQRIFLAWLNQELKRARQNKKYAKALDRVHHWAGVVESLEQVRAHYQQGLIASMVDPDGIEPSSTD